MNKKFFNKIVWILLLVSMLFSQCFTLFSQAHGKEELSSAYLSKIGTADYHLKYRTAERNSYTIVSIVGHYIGDTFYPAYCVNPELPGAETSPYTVSIDDVYNNPAVWRVLMHGYPYQSPESMGLSMFDAYFVTKMAIYCVIGVSDINAFNYDAGDTVAATMLAKLQELVDYGLNGTETMQTSTLSYNKIGDFTEAGNYYYQEYTVSSSVDIQNYTIYYMVGFGDGTYIGNTAGSAQNTFSNGEHFRVYIPKASITDNINGKIFINGKTKIYPILYGESGSSEWQNYVITSDPFGDEDIELTLNVAVNNGKIRINKTDKDTGANIQGIVFGLYKNGSEVQRQTTNSNGVAEFNSLLPGSYIVKEISTLNNYVLSSQEFSVDVKYNGTEIINVTNEKKKGQVKVIKIDEDYHDIKLSGVVFKLYNEAGQEVDTLTTNEQGEATSKMLPIDQTYTLKEISTDNNYIFSKNEQQVILNQNSIKTITITNKHKEGNLQVYKVDKDNHRVSLGGVDFDLFSVEFNRVIGRYATDQNGEIYIPNLRTGNYRLHEIKTNKWYNLADTKNLQVNWDETTNTTIENELKKVQVKIIKIDKDNHEVKLKGVKFEVLDSNNNVLEKLITNDNGECITNAYPVRDFEKLFLKETETLESYKLNDEIQEIVLEENQITTINFENEVKKGQIKIIKVDKDNNEVKLQGVTFDVLDESGNIVEQIITDENGEAITSRLPISQSYTLRESDTLENYTLSDETQTILLQEDEIKNITFENEKKKGQIEIIKVDGDNTEVKLEGVTFEVYDENDNLIQTLITDSEGKAITERIPIDVDYYVKETITGEFYKLTDEIQTVTLEENQITSLTFENYKKKGKIQVIKVDMDNHEVKLADVTFEVYNEAGELIETLATDENGEAITSELPIDETYQVKETITGKFYKLTEEPQKAVLTEDEITTLTFENEKKKGQIEIIKVDSDNNEVKLEGVIFEILDKDGKVVDSIKTDKDGKAVSKRLPIDNEYLVREKETRKEYLLTDKTEKIVLEEDEIKSITFENTKKKGTIKIVKVSSQYSELLQLDAGTRLQGAKFVIVDENQNEIGTYTTNENGEILLEKIPYGKYTIYEIECPEGFLLDSNPQTISIEENGQVVEVEFKDSPVMPELPKTGVETNVNVVIIAIVLVAMVAVIMLKNLKRKIEE